MGIYSVPAEIRALRPQGTQVKRQGDLFYVYETSSTKRKFEDGLGGFVWKTVTKSGKCIGSITLRDGFIPNNNRLADDEITVFDYTFAMNSSKTLAELKGTFNADDANQIYVAALITFVNGFTYMQDMSRIFKESCLCHEFPNVRVGEDALRTLYENLGKKGGKAKEFQQKLIDSAKKVAFDGHVIACTSENNDLSAYGYKAAKLNSEQVNWMAAYDIMNRKPIASEMFNGSDPDKTVIQDFFDRYTFKDTLFIVDRGFNTAANKKLFSSDGNTYIMPMISNRQDYQWVYERIKFDKRKCFIYSKDGYSSLIYYQDFKLEKEGKRYLAFLDTTRADAERKTYVENIRAGEKGYTEEGLIEHDKDFGLFLLETSDMQKTPKEVFCDYKSRWEIETFYNYVDNTLDFNSLYQQDYCRTEGLCFIIHITGMIYHELVELVTPHHLTLKKVMKTFKGIKLTIEKNAWKLKNYVKEKRQMAEQLNVKFNVPKTSPA